MTYTRETERRFQEANEAVKAAEGLFRPLKNARDDAMGLLGGLLLQCPIDSGTHGAANWAVHYAEELTDLLAPFVKQPEKS